MLKFFLSVVGFLIVHVVYGQLPEYYINKVQENAGLKIGEIISITKDTNGFLWLASQTKVQQFDGINCITYVFDEIIDQITSDNYNNIWVVTKQHVFLLNRSNQKFIKKRFVGLGSTKVQTICVVNNLIYLITNNKVYSYLFARDEIKELPNSILSNSWASKTPLIHIAQKLLFCNTDSLFCYNLVTQKKQGINLPFCDELLPLNDSIVLIGTNRLRMYLLNVHTQNLTQITNNINKPFSMGNFLMAYDAVSLQANEFIISTSKGLLKFNASKNQFSKLNLFYKGEPFANENSVSLVFKDKANTIFLISNDGIFTLNTNQSGIQLLRNFKASNLQLPNNIRDFSEDINKNLWMATTEGVFVLNTLNSSLQKINFISLKSQFNFSSIRQVLVYNNFCYIGTAGQGVYIYNIKTKQTKKVYLLQNSKPIKSEIDDAYIWKIEKLLNNDLFIATGKACYTFSPKTNNLKPLNFTTPSYNSRASLQDSLGNIWYGTSYGLVVLDAYYKTKFYIKDSFPDKRIAAFCPLNKTTMLIATNGLYKVELRANNSFLFTKLKSIEGNRFIYCMQKDINGNVWLGTDDGLIKYNPNTNTYLYFDGFQNAQTQAFNSDGAFLHSSGIIYFGGKNGLNYFNPSRVNSHEDLLKPSVFSLSFNNKTYSNVQPNQQFSIPHNQSKINIVLSTPNFTNPFTLTYKYRLSNYEDWIYIGTQNQINLQSLASGNYNLQIAVSTNNSNWLETSNLIQLTILKPWWLSNWFVTLLVLGFCISAFFVFYSIKKWQQTKSIKQAIQYFSNSSFNQNSLTDILWDITSNCVARLGLEECVIYIANHQSQTLHQRAAYGNKNPAKFEIANPIIIPFGKGIVGTVAITGKAEIIKNTTQDSRYIIDDEKRLSEITVPIIFENEVIGIIDSEHKKANFFNSSHLNALQTIANICSSKISNSLANEALQLATQKLNALDREIKEITFLNLRLQMNPHFLFNSLTSIQHLIVSQQTNKAYKYLTIFSNFLRSILKYAEETFISLDDEIKLLNMYIALESLGFDDSYSYQLTISEEIEQEEFFVPPLLIQPFIENAIWHGLKNKEGKKFFSIDFSLIEEDTLCCTIYDNGIGRKAALIEKQKNLSEIKHESKAVFVTNKRLQLLQEKTNKPAYLEYDDTLEGTTVRIYFPYFNY